MSGAKQPRQAHRNHLLGPALTTLAFWQLRRTWFLLLFIAFGMIAAIVIASAILLLSNVMMTAGLRNTLRATPDSADIQLLTQSNGISTPVVQKIHDQFDPLFHRCDVYRDPLAMAQQPSDHHDRSGVVTDPGWCGRQSLGPHGARSRGRFLPAATR